MTKSDWFVKLILSWTVPVGIVIAVEPSGTVLRLHLVASLQLPVVPAVPSQVFCACVTDGPAHHKASAKAIARKNVGEAGPTTMTDNLKIGAFVRLAGVPRTGLIGPPLPRRPE